MTQGIWGDIMTGLGAVPGMGAAVDLPRALVQGIQGKDPRMSLLEAIPGVGELSAAAQFGGVSKPPSMGGQQPGSSTDQTIQQQLKGLTFGQASGADATSLAKQLTGELQNLPSADAEKIISQVEKQYSGTSLASDLASDVSPPSQTPTSASPSTLYGFDPLSLGQMFEKTMAPWLAQQQQLGNKEQSALDSQLNTTLKSASPAYQQAFAPTIAAMNAAQNLGNEATNSALATAPQWDTFVSSLTDAISAAKLAQAAAQAEPYWAATTGVGTVPSGSNPGASTTNTLQQMYNSIVGGTH